MDKQLAIELIQSDVYNNPVIELHPDECQALFEAIVNLIDVDNITGAMAAFRAALGIGFKAGREDAGLDVFRNSGSLDE